MQAFIESGSAVDLVLAVIAAEFAIMSATPGRRSRIEAALDAVFALAPGVCLLLALRAALTGAEWQWPALWVALSFPFHLTDLWRRRRSEDRTP